MIISQLQLVWRLFSRSLITSVCLYFVALILVSAILGLNHSYRFSLEQEFATKQPHISIRFVENDRVMDFEAVVAEMDMIKRASPLIGAIAPYTTGSFFVSSLALKSGGNAQFNGDVKVIGLGKEAMLYDFYSASYVFREPFQIPYTPLEFVHRWQQDNQLMVYNRALFGSYFPVIAGVEEILFQSDLGNQKGQLAGVFSDYDTSPIIYTSIVFANELLGKKERTTDGFHVNVVRIEDVDKVKDTLQEQLDGNRYIISSWLEEHQKQFVMFTLFESLSAIIIVLILLLTILFIVLVLYNSIVRKSHQLSVIFMLGYNLKFYIFGAVSSIALATCAVVSWVNFLYLPELMAVVGLPCDEGIAMSSFVFIWVITAIFTIVAYYIISSSYKLSSKNLLSDL